MALFVLLLRSATVDVLASLLSVVVMATISRHMLMIYM
jgi:hypothetical protein